MCAHVVPPDRSGRQDAGATVCEERFTLDGVAKEDVDWGVIQKNRTAKAQTLFRFLGLLRVRAALLWR